MQRTTQEVTSVSREIRGLPATGAKIAIANASSRGDMNIRFSIAREGKQIAALVADVVKPADIAAAVERVFEKARKETPVPLWDCNIEMRPAEVLAESRSA